MIHHRAADAGQSGSSRLSEAFRRRPFCTYQDSVRRAPYDAGRVAPVVPRDWLAEAQLLPEGVAHQADRYVCDEQQRDEHGHSEGGRRQGSYCRPLRWRGGTVVVPNRLSLPDAVLNRAGYYEAHASNYHQHDD